MNKINRREALKVTLAGVDFGHTVPQLTLPIGIQASLDSQQDRFSINEEAVW